MKLQTLLIGGIVGYMVARHIGKTASPRKTGGAYLPAQGHNSFVAGYRYESHCRTCATRPPVLHEYTASTDAKRFSRMVV